jgi:hypothetical protein
VLDHERKGPRGAEKNAHAADVVNRGFRGLGGDYRPERPFSRQQSIQEPVSTAWCQI